MNVLNKSFYLSRLMPLMMFIALFQVCCAVEESAREKPVYFDLNHFYISIDRASFEAFREHPEILTNYFESLILGLLY